MEEKKYVPPKGSKVNRDEYFDLINQYNVCDYIFSLKHNDEYKVALEAKNNKCGTFHVRKTFVDCYVPYGVELINKDGSGYEHYKSGDVSGSYRIIINSPAELLNAIVQLIKIKKPEFILDKVNGSYSPINPIVNINDGIAFNKSVDVINTYLGKNNGANFKAYYKISDNGDGIGFWFPKMAKKENGTLKAEPNSKGWLNVFDDGGNTIFMNHEDSSEIDNKIVRTGVHVTFAFDGQTKQYKYVGNYLQNKKRCTNTRICFERIGTTFDFTPYYSVTVPETEEEQENQAQELPIELLEKTAKARESTKPPIKTISSQQIVRDPYIAEYAKKRAKGTCQLCGNPAPFNNSKGEPYLESHHIIWLADGGEDTIENTVALCPNCHRKMHIIADEVDVKKLQDNNKQ